MWKRKNGEGNGAEVEEMEKVEMGTNEEEWRNVEVGTNGEGERGTMERGRKWMWGRMWRGRR